MVTYLKPNDLTIKETPTSFILSRGVLHKQTLEIDKLGSSEAFLSRFSSLVIEGFVNFDKKNDEVANDFHKLSQFRLIDEKILFDRNEKPVVIVDEEMHGFCQLILGDQATLISPYTILSQDEIDKILEQKDVLAIKEIQNNFSAFFQKKMLYLICDYSSINFIRAINKLMKKSEQPWTLAFSDNDHIFITSMKYGETGCYECLENQLISKFPGHMEDYLEDNLLLQNTTKSKVGFILSIISNEINSISLYGSSELLGNVLHFYLPTYEYDYNFNKRQTSCMTCATLNQILFSEQGIKSVNILREITHD